MDSEALGFKSFMESAHEAIVVLDVGATIIFANRQAAALSGYSADELRGLGAIRLLDPEEHARLSRGFKARIEGTQPRSRYDTTLIRKDGTRIPIEVSSSRLRWGGRTFIVVIARDISTRKQTNETLTQLLEQKTAEIKTANAERQEAHRYLNEANVALRVILRNMEDEKKELQARIISNVEQLILPYVEKLKHSDLTSTQAKYMNALEATIRDLVSPFSRTMSSVNLTPTELQVSNLVKIGRSTKEIAEVLNISLRTVCFHRENVRKKLGLNNKKANLRSYLLSLE